MQQDNENNVFVSAYSLLNAVGGNTQQVITSVAAGISAYAVEKDEETGDSLNAASFPEQLLPEITEDMQEELEMEEHFWHLLRLGKLCLEEFMQNLPENLPPVPLLVLTPDWNQNMADEDYQGFAQAMVQLAGVSERFSQVKERCGGRSSGLQALSYAVSMIRSGRLEMVAIGSIESFSNEDYLLDMQERLLGEDVLDGFIPGEGAAFMLLTNHRLAQEFGLDRTVAITSVASANEEGHLNSDHPYKGEALSEAFRQVLKEEPTKISKVFCSLNGESIWAKEWGVALIRNKSHFEEELDLNHPAECFGDLGVATGLTLSALAVETIKRNGVVSPVLVWCSDDFAPRYAMLIKAMVSG